MLSAALGVQLHISSESITALYEADRVFASHALPCVLTSGTEGLHVPGSAHGQGRALDFRIRHAPPEQWDDITSDLQAALPQRFTVNLERQPPAALRDTSRWAPHIHVEWP